MIDHLKVHRPLGGVRRDDEVRAAALQRLSADADIHAEHLHVKVSDGHLTLTGRVRHQAQREAAEADIATVPGVVDVINQIEVR